MRDPGVSLVGNFMSFSRWDFVLSSLAAWAFLLFGSQQHSGNSGLANQSGVSLLYKVPVILRKTARQGFTSKTQRRDDFPLQKRTEKNRTG